MQRTIVVILVILALAGVVHAQENAGIGDPDFPLLGNSGYDAQHYTIDLAADVEANTLTGTVTMTAILTEDVQSFNLDFASNFAISQVTLNGAAAKFEQQAHELVITPDVPLAAGDEIEVSVTYSGEPLPVDTIAIPVKLGWNNYGTGVYVASEPDGSAGWYPVNDHPLDKATYTFRITVPKPYVVAANGVLTNTIDNGETSTYVWESRHPMASYLVTLGIDDFTVQTSESPDGVPIRNYFPPEVAEEAAASFAPTGDMIAFYSDLIAPYPFDAYGVLVADVDLPFALETQTMTLFARSWLMYGNGLDEAVAHELAHQWFGDSVSVSRWGDIWLNEGFATYMSWLWFEHAEGPQALERIVSQMVPVLEQMSRADVAPPGTPPADDLFNFAVYYRGALTLHALRLQVGDDAFFEILRTYYNRYQYGNATTEGFIAVAETISGQDLGDFFNGWLYETALPVLP